MEEACLVAVPAEAGGEGRVWGCASGAAVHALPGLHAPPGAAAAALGPGAARAHGVLLACQVQPKHAVLCCTWGAAAPAHRSFLVEPMKCVAFAAGGAFVVGGGQSGRLYAWEARTGLLLAAWDAHYREVTQLRALADGVMLLSGGGEGLVHAWNLVDVLAKARAGGGGHGAGGGTALQPWATWADHRLPVTGLASAQGDFHRLVASSSLDQTCRLFIPGHRKTVCTLRMPCALHAVGVDRNEQVLYAGGADGRIFAKDLVVPAGVATAEHPLGAELSEELPGHSQAVTGIEFGPEGLHMFSGSLDGQVRMWDMESHQTLRTFDLQSPVACIRVFPRADFDRGAQQGAAGRKAGQLPVQPLKKYAAAGGGLEAWAGPPQRTESIPLGQVPLEDLIPGFAYRSWFKAALDPDPWGHGP